MYSPFLVLDLKEDADESDVETAYRSLSKRLSPGSLKLTLEKSRLKNA